MHKQMHKHKHTRIHVRMYMHMHTNRQMHLHMHTYLHRHMHMHMHMHMHTHMHPQWTRAWTCTVSRTRFCTRTCPGCVPQHGPHPDSVEQDLGLYVQTLCHCWVSPKGSNQRVRHRFPEAACDEVPREAGHASIEWWSLGGGQKAGGVGGLPGPVFVCGPSAPPSHRAAALGLDRSLSRGHGANSA